MQEATIEDLHAQLTERTSVTLVALPIAELAGIEVTGSSRRDVSIGADSRYGAQEIKELPSISRDIKDVVRIDPKAWVDPTNADALEVAGVNNRYNTITVDGVRQSDDFGLNNNGYPTQRSPLSVDAIEAVSVLSAPFSVEYSFFRGSTINMVTKSGTNEFRGSGFYYKGDDSLLGDRTGDTDVNLVFDEDVYGGTLGGPIIRDRLFFFLSYEKLEREAPQDIGATGSGFPVEVPNVSQSDYDRIRQIGLDVYGFDVGQTLASAPEEDEKILAKLDWNVNDSNRASLAYQRTEGNELIVNNTNNNPALFRLGAPSNWYDREILMETASVQLFSDWSEIFSTELKLARKEVDTAQVSLFGTDFGEMIVTTTDGGTVYIGSDEFRHANELANDVDSIKLTGSFFLGDHALTVGYEREMLDIFNIFVPRSQGQWVFNNIDNFEDQVAASLSYNNAFTNDAADGAAAFGYDVDSFYVQDEWQGDAGRQDPGGRAHRQVLRQRQAAAQRELHGTLWLQQPADTRRARPLHAAHRLQLAADAGNDRVRRVRPVRRRHAERVDLQQFLERRRDRLRNTLPGTGPIADLATGAGRWKWLRHSAGRARFSRTAAQ